MNNRIKLLLIVLSAAFLSGCYPDLIVESLDWDGKRASAKICNIKERYEGSFSVSFTYEENPTPTHYRQYRIIKPDISFYESDGSFYLDCQWCYADFAPLICEPRTKPYKITVKADSTDKVKEDRENNNTHVKVVP